MFHGALCDGNSHPERARPHHAGGHRDHLKLTPQQMREEIQRLHSQTVDVLARKGIQCFSLRSGLSAVLKRYEVVFIFDSSAAAPYSYGPEVPDILSGGLGVPPSG